MAEPLLCWRCGASLAELSLPFGRRDECPKCRAELHVCRMCMRYAPRLARGCDEDDAPDVRNKEAANFCDYYRPSRNAFDAERAGADAAARAELAKLFGEPGAAESPGQHAPESGPEPKKDPEPKKNDLLSEAEALFKR